MTSKIDLTKLVALLIGFTLLGYLLIAGQAIIAPIVFSLFLSLLVLPVLRFFERRLSKIGAILMTFLVVALPMMGVILISAYQFVEIFQELPSVSSNLKKGLEQVLSWLHQRIPVIPDSISAVNFQETDNMVWAPLGALQAGVSVSLAFLANLLLTFIYSFLFLLYRGAIQSFLLIQVGKDKRQELREVLRRIKEMVQDYLTGLGSVIIILFVFNSLSLWLIGIDYAIFWGGLSALLVILPYIGSFLGGFLPFLYTIATTDNFWQPATVAGVFIFIQLVEGNFITPKIVGNSVRVNPFVAIFSMVISGAAWGIAGLVLAIPVVAVLKVLLEEINPTKPLAVLFSNEILEKEGKLLEEYDEDKFRIMSYFGGRKKKKDTSG